MLSIEDVINRGRNDIGYSEKTELILQKLSQNAYSTREVAEFLNITKPGAHAKLNKLAKSEFLTKKFVDGEYYFFTNVDKVKNEPEYKGIFD